MRSRLSRLVLKAVARSYRSLVASLTVMLLSGCATAPPTDSTPPVSQLDAVQAQPRVESASVRRVLAFARWTQGATVDDLQASSIRLNHVVEKGADPDDLFRLALVLNEPRTPGADPARARELLVRVQAQAGSPEYGALRDLAAILGRHWRDQDMLTRELRNTEEQGKQVKGVLARERNLRRSAEKRLEALINVERRAKRASDPIMEVKPVLR